MFRDILGNEDLKEILNRLRLAGRIPNAMLFAGPDGVGKRLFALEIARSYVCRSEDVGSACGKCPACVRTGRFAFPKPDDRDAYKKVIFSDHPDVGMVAAPGRQIAVDAIRDLESEAHFRPYEGGGRTFIVDEADKLNDSASNALLKTLEEPAPTSNIILITSRPDTLLSTIRSRCQTFRFAPVPAEQIQAFLIDTGVMPENEARLAARMSQGSVGLAIAIDVSRIRERRDEMTEVLNDGLVRQDLIRLLRASENLAGAQNKDLFDEDLELLLTLIRDVWTITVGGSEGTLVHIDIFHHLEKIAQSSDAKMLSGLMTEIELMRERFAVNINKKLAADALFVKMAA
jgi:DNA polymerase-3 subunit delta'